MRKILMLLAAVLIVLLGGCTEYLPTSGTTTATTQTTAITESSQPTSTLTGVTTAATITTTTAAPTTVTTAPQTEATTIPATTLPPPTASTTITTTISTARYQTIEIYGMNDFHGGAYTDPSMIAKIGNFLIQRKALNEDAIFLAHGDMLQGTALSNYYYGLPIIEALNIAGFSGFTIGNHEFDWGIEMVGAYRDGDPANGEADYPLLAANIVYTDTQELLPWFEPYTIIESGPVRIGVIGVIGPLQGSISASRLTNITFLDLVNTVADYAQFLRTEADCDIVIVSAHDYNSYTNYQLASLTGNSRIDAIFNGHSHTSVAGIVPGTNVPYAQASNYSSSLFTKITLVYDNQMQTITSAGAEVFREVQLTTANPAIDAMLGVFLGDEDYQSFVTHVLATAQASFGRSALAPWGASVIRDYAGVDFGVVNGGGFRVTMDQGAVTNGDLVVIYPFDNTIRTCELTGQQLTDFYASAPYDLYFDDQVSYSGGVLYKNGVPVVLSQLYTVGAVDYVFDKDNFIFLDGENITTTPYMMRDLLANDLENAIGQFNPANGTSFTPTVPVAYDYHISLFKIAVVVL